MKIFDNATLSRSSLTVIGSSGSGILAVVMWIEDILEYNDDDGDDDGGFHHFLRRLQSQSH